MGFSPVVGRVLGAIAFVSSLGACGGQSEFAPDDGAGGGETQGGTGSGGASPIAGTSGIGAAGGAAPSCPECPPDDYALVIEGDGAPYEMRYNGLIDASSDLAAAICSEEPLRGWVGGCRRAIVVWACEQPTSGRPCLEINDGMVSYVDRQRGELFTGNVTTDIPMGTTSPSVKSGTLTLSLANAAGDMLFLAVSYRFCATALSSLRIVC